LVLIEFIGMVDPIHKVPVSPTEQGREHCARVLKSATIITGINNSEISCTIRNQHKNGAQLTVSPEVEVPREFLLYVPIDGVAYRSELRWRRNDRIGVRFSGTEPKPRLHYS
jgi:phosphomannomutase